MCSDIRIDVDFYDHPKTIKLQRRFGSDGLIALQRLWVFAAKHKSSGELTSMDAEEISIAMRWQGDCEAFVAALVDLRWLDIMSGQYVIHDWSEHNPWAAASADRSDKARFSKMASLYPDIYAELKAKGYDSITVDTYKALTCCKRVALDAVNDSLNDSLVIRSSPTPSPTPSPTTLKTKTTSCIEPEKAPDSVPSDSKTENQQTSSIDCQQKKQPDSAQSPTQETQTQQPVVISIPLVCKKTGPPVEFGVTQALVEDWTESYPGVDVMQTLREIRQWNLSNPTKRKTNAGIMNHITNWLAREQNKGGHARLRASPAGSNGRFNTIIQTGDPTLDISITNAANFVKKHMEDIQIAE